MEIKHIIKATSTFFLSLCTTIGYFSTRFLIDKPDKSHMTGPSEYLFEMFLWGGSSTLSRRRRRRDQTEFKVKMKNLPIVQWKTQSTIS